MYENAKEHFARALAEIRDAGLWKHERVDHLAAGAPTSRSAAARCSTSAPTTTSACRRHPRVIAAAHAALDDRGYGLSSVRFICGTQDLHKELEAAIATFLGTEDTILYGSCFDANGGLFETLLGEEDAIISDALNHASIIDGIRLCKAERHRYAHDDMADLEAQARRRPQGKRLRMIATDGVFSMDGDIARLDAICDLAEKYGALVMVDDCHATGFVGKTGRGTAELRGCMDRIDVFTSTLGKALGGASGGFTTGKQGDRRSAAPALAAVPVLEHAGAADRRRRLAAFALISRVDRAARHARGQHPPLPRGHDRGRLRRSGPATHPIVPVMLGDAKLAGEHGRSACSTRAST